MPEQYIEELIQKYTDGTASNEEVQALMHWYRSASIEEVPWPAADSSAKQDIRRRMLNRLQHSIFTKPAQIFNIPWSRVAALLVLLLGVTAILVYYVQPVSKSYITVTNPSGKIQLVNLPDNSTVWLNASSTIRYVKDFAQTRDIALEGEAYFTVTPDAKHPFTVEAGGVQTRVVGTAFNIKAYGPSNTTTITVIDGKVKVSDDSTGLALLTPAMQLQFDRLYRTAKTVVIDTNSVLAWQKGRLQFQGETLAEIAGTLETWYGVKMIFSDPGMRSCRYYMSFDNTISLDKLLSTMSEITEMQYRFDKSRNTIILSGKECQ